MKVVYRPVGVVRSPFSAAEGMPIQPSRARGVRGTVELEPEYAEGLQDLEGFSHAILLCHLHRSRGFTLKVVPFLDDTPRGVFATRAPRRPNPIGLSVVRIVSIEGNRMTFEGVDLIDGTPLLDIKPYVPEFDEREDIRLGWLEAARRRDSVADDRFVERDVAAVGTDLPRVRPAVRADSDAIWEVHSSAIRKVCAEVYAAHQIEAWAGALAPDRYHEVIDELVVVVAEEGAAIVGFGQLDPEHCLVQAIYVRPDRLRAGIGRRLLRELEAAARAAGCARLWLRSTLNAVPFYEAMGFERVGDAVHELGDGTRLPCVEMRRSLRDAG